MDAQALTNLYESYLTEEGYTPEVDSDGDVTFKYEGGFYYINIDENDPHFFKLVYPNFWIIHSPAERARAYIIADRVNRTIKVVNIHLNSKGDKVSATAEGFFNPPNTFRPIFHRALQVLKAGAQKFAEEMKEG